MQRLWMKRVPVLLQMSAVECGLASLAMVLSYYGRKTSVLELRTKYGVGRDGASARTIVKAARDFGMRVRAISLQKSDFSHIKLPAIVHWQFKHFLVVERWSQKHVDVVDPALGRRRLSAHEFDAGFTGIIILLEPGVNFSRESPPVSLSLKTYIWQSIRQAPGTVVQVIGSSILLQLFGLVTPILTKIVVDQILPFKLHDVMSILAAGMLMLIFAQGITTLLREWLLVYLRARIDTHLVLGFFEHLLSLPYSFFQQRSSGDLLMRMGSNTIIRDILSGQLVSTLLDSGMVVLYLLILLWQSPPFALLTLVIGLLQVLLVVGTYRPVRRLADEELAAQGQSQGYMAEALSGIATIKAAGAEYQAHERWSNLFFGQLNISIRRSYLSALLGMALTALRSFSSLALLWLGASEVLNGSITVGSMLALNTLAVAFLDPLTSLVGRVQQLLLAQAHLQRLADIMTAEPEQDVQKVHVPPRLTGHIRLENVSFQYTPDTPKVLHSLNVTIQAGQKVAIVGRTGSGKSTLGQLLLGLYLPTEGEIYYDHMPLHKLQYQEVRRQFGVVLQESTVFSGTILQNIMLNNPAMEKEQAIRAAQIAAIHEDIVRMPLGYETFVSEGGSALSGGQRQRLAIARAVAHHPAILLLDEATSALDVVTERRVAQNLESFPCTQIIIAHRLSTIRHADLIIVLEQGTIVEQGTHDELLRHNGYYAHLIRQQMEKERGDAQMVIKPKFTIG
ncbi:MAG: peptidase domain-containing ABC transporter [Ktedonobacteraceae bacterium]|nr:peptidase domain-containing ABC transporter [Ktedonobacteraceae bacterium]